jgi:hypothetical protein
MRTVNISTVRAHELTTFDLNLDKNNLCAKYTKRPMSVVEVAPTQEAWDEVMNGPYISSPHVFKGGLRKNVNWLSCDALFLDFDSTVPLEQVVPRLSGLNYYTNYSNGHNPDLGIIKFHLYLPLNSGVTDPEVCEQLMEWMLVKYPELDKNSRSLARYSIRGNSNYPTRFVGDQQDLDVQTCLAELAEHRLARANKLLQEQARVVATSKKNTDELEIFNLETQVKSNDGKIAKLGDLDPEAKPQFLCPICGEKPGRGNPGSHNATYQLSRTDGKPIVYCSSCAAEGRGAGGKGVYNLVLDDQHKWIEKKKEFTIFRDLPGNRFIDRRLSKSKDTWVMNAINREGITNRYALHGVKAPASFPEYEIKMGFDKDHWLDEDRGVVYKYQATRYLTEPLPAGFLKMPRYTGLLLKHVTGNGAACYEYFLDWLAAIVQLRRKLLTSWVLHGVQGTGKGILYHSILKPLLGEAFTAALNQDSLESRFNSVFQDCVFIVFDEVQVDFSKHSGNSVNARIKLLITEEMMNFEPKGIDAKQGENECNFLFFSNQGNAVKIEENDRRFNVAPRQETKLVDASWLPAGGIDLLKRELASELDQFAVFLRQRVYNGDVVHLPLNTDAKLAMIAATRTSGEDFFLKMIKPLDWELIEENLDYHVSSSNFNSGCSVQAHAIVSRHKSADEGDPLRSYLTNDEITALYNNIVNTNRYDVKKGSVSKKAGAVGMAMSVFRDINGNPVRGWKL